MFRTQRSPVELRVAASQFQLYYANDPAILHPSLEAVLLFRKKQGSGGCKMDPNLALILTALTTGAQGVANEAAKDAYHGLKTLIQRKFKGQPDEQSAQVAL